MENKKEKNTITYITDKPDVEGVRYVEILQIKKILNQRIHSESDTLLEEYEAIEACKDAGQRESMIKNLWEKKGRINAFLTVSSVLSKDIQIITIGY